MSNLNNNTSNHKDHLQHIYFMHSFYLIKYYCKQSFLGDSTVSSWLQQMSAAYSISHLLFQL
ncbi:hypothetical protein Syun_012027 [Stephania yunnanensis]|uniref:Uncharacterized protein n=1 Tax=Stephania yunnanensis TaxID=152371 RepID=A0AAP0PG19_9MAGN